MCHVYPSLQMDFYVCVFACKDLVTFGFLLRDPQLHLFKGSSQVYEGVDHFRKFTILCSTFVRGFLLREKTLKPYLKQAQVAASPLIPSRRSRLCLSLGWRDSSIHHFPSFSFSCFVHFNAYFLAYILLSVLLLPLIFHKLSLFS